MLKHIDLLRITEAQADLSYVYNRMEILLNDNKVKFPAKDFSESEAIINLIKKNADILYDVEQANNTIFKVIQRLSGEVSGISIDNKLLIAKIKDLEIENETIKNNIQI
jgi:hypothetical protein